jgi:hypothetical protein
MPQKALTLSRKVDECKPLGSGGGVKEALIADTGVIDRLE